MSHHHKEETIICPNCGFHATKNYCAQCGQETHLHKETFFGLIFHFVSHYFHYDSKFWQTLKTLFTKPGKLTVEYWEKKRARHIPPISLYIFVSAVFFILFFLTMGSRKNISEFVGIGYTNSGSVVTPKLDTSVHYVALTPDKKKVSEEQERARKVFSDPEQVAGIFDTVIHAFPKFFFFMIPLMAFLLKLLYMRRKETYFVEHAVFSLHIHAFSIIMLLLTIIHTPTDTRWYHEVIIFVQNIVPFIIIFYLAVAIRNAYRSGWMRSILYSILITICYGAFFLILFMAYFAIVAEKAVESANGV